MNSNRLFELRKMQGVTQEEVAKTIGCSANNYSRYERGDCQADYETLRRLSKYFHTSIDHILYNDEVAADGQN